METMQTYIAYQGQMALLKSSRINSIKGQEGETFSNVTNHRSLCNPTQQTIQANKL